MKTDKNYSGFLGCGPSSLTEPNQKCAIGLFIIIILAFFLRVAAFYGYFGSDDGCYAKLAYMMVHGQFKFGGDFNFCCRTMPPVQPLRLGLILPVALCFKIWGPNEITMVLYPFIISMLSVPLVFIIAREFFSSKQAGLMAAFIQAILPIDVKSASILLPDLCAAFWANCGIILLFFGSKRDSAISKTVYGVLAGLGLVVSWLCKESLFYLFPFVGGFSLWMIYQKRRNLYMLAGAVFVLIIGLFGESVFYHRYTGDFLYRLHEIGRNFEHGKMWFFTEGSRVGYEKGHYYSELIRRLLIIGPRTILTSWSYGLTTIVAMLAIVYALHKRWRSYIFIGAWFLAMVLMFNFFSPNFKTYQPLHLRDRDLYPIFLPALLLTAGLISFLFSGRRTIANELFRERAFWGGVLTVCILSICSLKICQDIFILNDGSPGERAAAQLLSPSDRVYTDSRTREILSFFWGFPPKTEICDFAGMKRADIPAGSYVLVNRRRVSRIHESYGYVLPEFYESIPPEWIAKWRGHQAELYITPGKE